MSRRPSIRLDPLLRERFHRLCRWPRVLLLRRIAASALAAAAVVLALRPDAAAAEHGSRIVVAAHDVSAGSTLRGNDIALRWTPEAAIPAGARSSTTPVLGQVLVGPARAGEPITDVRLVGPANSRLSGAGPGWTSVGVRLADPAVADLLRPGDHVDVVAGTDGNDEVAAPIPAQSTSDAIAEDAVVLTVRPAADSAASTAERDGRMVVLSLPRGDATRVAASALRQPVAVTLRTT